MNILEDYLLRVRELVSSVASVLTTEERDEVAHLIDHGEPAEALRTLAWIIVEENKQIRSSVVSKIRELSAGLVDEADLPNDLDKFAAD